MNMVAKTQKSNETLPEYPRIYSASTFTARKVQNGDITKLVKIIHYIDQVGPQSKYDILTKLLNEQGTRKQLRGMWSTNFAGFRTSGLLNYDYGTKKYSLTDKSIDALESWDAAYFL